MYNIGRARVFVMPWLLNYKIWSLAGPTKPCSLTAQASRRFPPPWQCNFSQSEVTHHHGSVMSARWKLHTARVNQHPPMHQLAVLSTGWAVFFHSAPDGVHHSPFFFFFAADHCTSFFFLFFDHFSLGLDLTHSYLTHLPTLISTAPTLVPYLLSLPDIAALITNYPIDLTTILTTYHSNLITLLITYPINLLIILTTYHIDLATLYTQPLY